MNSEITTVDLPDDNYQFINTYNRKTSERLNKILEVRQKNLERKNINFLQIDSFYLSNYFQSNYFDLIWVDGDHLNPQVTIDIFHAIKLCKKGGIICVDDIIKESLKNNYVSNDSYLTLESLNIKKILKSYYFIKNISVYNMFYKKYVSYGVKE